MNGKRKAPSNDESQNGGKENDGGKRSRLEGAWAVKVDNVKASDAQDINFLVTFIKRQVCPLEKELHWEYALGEGLRGIRTLYFEFKNNSQRQAALKLNGSLFANLPLTIRSWTNKDFVDNYMSESPFSDPEQSPSLHHISDTNQSTSSPIESKDETEGRWAIEVSGMMPKGKNLKKVEGFFESKLDSKRLASIQLSQNGEKSIFFEFRTKSQQQAALKLDGQRCGGWTLRIRPWVFEESIENSNERTTDGKEFRPPCPHPVDNDNKSISGPSETQSPINDKGLATHTERPKDLAGTNAGTNTEHDKRIPNQLHRTEDVKSGSHSQQETSNTNHCQEPVATMPGSLGDQLQRQFQETSSRLGLSLSGIRSQSDEGDSISNQQGYIANNIPDTVTHSGDTCLRSGTDVDEKAPNLLSSLPDVETQQHQEDCIRNEAEQMKELDATIVLKTWKANLEAELEKQQLENAFKDTELRNLRDTIRKRDIQVTNNKNQIANQKRKIESQAKQIKSLNQEIDRHMSRVAKFEAQQQQKDALEKMQQPRDDSLPVSECLLDMATLVRQNGSLRIDLLAKDLAHEKEMLQKRVNDLSKEGDTLSADFCAKEQAISHDIDLIRKNLSSLRSRNGAFGRVPLKTDDLESKMRQFDGDLLDAQQSISNLKQMIRNVEDGCSNVSTSHHQPMTRKVQDERLEVKLAIALRDQHKLLAENQQLQVDKQNMQRTVEAHAAENEKLLEQQQELEEELMQMRMNRAMEMGFMAG